MWARAAASAQKSAELAETVKGPATGRVVVPVKQSILVQSYGWAPGTNGRTEVPLVVAAFAANGKLSGDLSKLRGAAVLVDLASGTDVSTAPNYVVRRPQSLENLPTPVRRR